MSMIVACPACATPTNLLEYTGGDWFWCDACDAMLAVRREPDGSLTLIQKSPPTRTPKPPKITKTRATTPKKGSS